MEKRFRVYPPARENLKKNIRLGLQVPQTSGAPYSFLPYTQALD
jgi:hypothetical protein